MGSAADPCGGSGKDAGRKAGGNGQGTIRYKKGKSPRWLANAVSPQAGQMQSGFLIQVLPSFPVFLPKPHFLVLKRNSDLLRHPT